MKALKIVCVLFLAMLTLLLGCSKKRGTKPEPVKYKWTILGYFNGNNSQDEAPDGQSYVIKDLQELEQIGSTDDVHILVMLGSFKTDGNCKYYHVQRHPNEPPDVISSEVLRDLGRKDMSDPMSLRDFIGYGMENYPAEHYMLIINDHGGGWKGLCSDTVNGAGDWMSLPELSSALFGFEFDIIWFYTPFMATAEVAYQVRDRAEYMIASMFKYYPDNILGSAEWLPDLTTDPDRSVRVLATDITRAVYTAAQDIAWDKPVHSVLVHLTTISIVATDISNLGRELKDSTGSFWNEVWDAWDESHTWDQVDSAFIHLREFAIYIQNKPNLSTSIKNYAGTLVASIDDAVLVEFIYPYNLGPDVGGISIYLPWSQDEYDSASYVQLDFFETGWHSFISTFIQSFSGGFAGALNIISVPTGARVFLNSVDTGYETDVVIGDLLPGFYDIKLVKSGYQEWSGRKEVYPQTTTIVPVRLQPAP